MEKNFRPHFPMFVDLTNKQIVVFGAGKVALRRIQTLQFFRGTIRVIAKEIPTSSRKEIMQLIENHQIILQEKIFEITDIVSDIYMVLAATNDENVNETIYWLCKEAGILVNVATNQRLCDFYFPAIATKDEVVIGISGNGSNHKKVANLTKDIRNYLENNNEKSD